MRLAVAAVVLALFVPFGKARLALATEPSILGDLQKWGHPTADDLEEDPYWDLKGQELDLPEHVAESLALDKSARGAPPASTNRTPTVSRPFWVVPSQGLPMELRLHPSNNNVAIELHDGRLFMAWRTAPKHFASMHTRMIIVSSTDLGHTWELEHVIALGSDVREPAFLSFRGRLLFSFFQAGTNPAAFEPKHVYRIERLAFGQWTKPETWMDDGEIPWEIKVRGDKAWMTSYEGSHYSLGRAKVNVHFRVSDDGLHWRHVNGSRPTVYQGGVSEVGWEFDAKGDFWGVLRNEDGDNTGFGSHVAFAPGSDPAAWETPRKSNRNRYDSPRMFRHGEDIYLVARRDVRGPFDRGWSWMPFDMRRWLYLIMYSFRPKRTALYRLDRDKRKVVWLQDLPSAGDTAFPSLVQTGPDSWLVANYTSPLKYPKRTWIWGQLSPQGTQIYLSEIRF